MHEPRPPSPNTPLHVPDLKCIPDLERVPDFIILFKQFPLVLLKIIPIFLRMVLRVFFRNDGISLRNSVCSRERTIVSQERRPALGI